MAEPQVVALDGRGGSVVLGGRGLAHLQLAVREHLQHLHRSGIAAPRDLVDLAVAVSSGGRSGRVDGRELGDVPSRPQTRRVTYKEAADLHGVSTRTLRRWRKAGRIRGVGRFLIVETPAEHSG